MLNTDTPFFSPNDFTLPSPEAIDVDLQKLQTDYTAREVWGRGKVVAMQTHICKEPSVVQGEGSPGSHGAAGVSL